MTNEKAMTNDEWPEALPGGFLGLTSTRAPHGAAGLLTRRAPAFSGRRRAHPARWVGRPTAHGIKWRSSANHSSFRPSRLLLPIALAALAFSSGCITFTFTSHKQTQRDVYMHLMTPLEQSKFLYLEASDKPLSIQLAYLQEIGVYQKWVEVPKNKQEAILRREVTEGMTPLQVEMAWGRPGEERDETLPAERAEGHKKIVWEYGVRVSKAGGTSHERSVCFFDDRVLWVRQSR